MTTFGLLEMTNPANPPRYRPNLSVRQRTAVGVGDNPSMSAIEKILRMLRRPDLAASGASVCRRTNGGYVEGK